MDDQQLNQFAEEFVTLIQATGDPSFGKKPGEQYVAAYTESLPGLPKVRFPTADQVKGLLGTAFGLGRAVGAESVSISGGIGVSIGVSFRLPTMKESLREL